MKEKILIVLLFFRLISLFAESQAPFDKQFSELASLDLRKGDRKEALRLHDIAYASYLAGDIAAAHDQWFQTALADPSWEWSYYNLACTSSLLGKEATAMKYVEVALELSGGTMIHYMVNDSDLESLYSTMRSRALEIIPRSYLKKVIDRMIDGYSFGEDFVGFGENNLVAYIDHYSDFYSTNYGGPPPNPEEIPFEASNGINLVVLDMETLKPVHERKILYSYTREYSKHAGKNPTGDDLEYILNSKMPNPLIELIFDYKIEFFQKDSDQLLRVEKDSAESFVDKKSGAEFSLDWNDFNLRGTLGSLQFEEYLGYDFGLTMKLSGVYRKKDSPWYVIFVSGFNGNGDCNSSRTRCYVVKQKGIRLYLSGYGSTNHGTSKGK